MYIIFHYKKSTHIWISPNASRLCSISIIIFLFSFQALRQTRQQRRHLRISQNLHQKVRIHTFRNSHRVCCLTSICTLHLRIKIFPVIKRILHPLCILSPVLVNMSACACPESPWTALMSPPLSFSLYVTLVCRRLWKTTSGSPCSSITFCI